MRIPVTESVTGKTHPTQPTIATGLSPRHTQHKGHCSSYVSISGWTIPPIAEIDLCETNLSQVVRIRQTFWPSSYISLEQTKNHVPQYLGTLVWSNVSFALQLLYVPHLCLLERYHDYQLDTINHCHTAFVANTSATCSFAVRHILLPLPQASPMRHNGKPLSGRDHPDRSLQHK